MVKRAVVHPKSTLRLKKSDMTEKRKKKQTKIGKTKKEQVDK